MNILLIKPGAIGDLLQLTPVIRALKERLPHARITVLVANSASVDLFRYNPLVNETLIFDKRGTHRSWQAFGQLWTELRRRRFDLVINFQRSNLKAWLLVAASFPCQILIYHRSPETGFHAVRNHLQAVAPLGIDPDSLDLHLELYLGREDEFWAADLLERQGLADRQLVALNLGASHPVNRWPVEKFAELGGRLAQMPGVTVLLVGGTLDRDLADTVVTRLATQVIDLVGHTSLLQLGAVLRKCSVMVSGDTGPMHLATAVGTRVIALFGAADPGRTGPVGSGNRVIQAEGLACVPCKSRTCRAEQYMKCMDSISVDQVCQAVHEMLRENPTCAS